MLLGSENLQKRTENTQLWLTCLKPNFHCLLRQKIFLLIFNMNLISTYTHCLLPSFHTLALSSLYPPHRYQEGQLFFLLEVFSRLNKPLTSPHRAGAPTPAYLGSPLMNLLQFVNIYLALGSPNWARYSRCSLMSSEWRSITPPLDLPALLLLI